MQSLDYISVSYQDQAYVRHPANLHTVGQAELECVEHFTYLGSVTSKDGDVEKEVNTPLPKAATEDSTTVQFSWAEY